VFERGIVSAVSGHLLEMTDTPMEDMDRPQQEREADADHLLERQEHKGYGDDEGEREESLPDDE
jgi:hypothetical protein